MSDLNEDKEKTKLQRWMKNQGRLDFMKEVDGMQPHELSTKLLDLAKYNEEITNTMKADEDLKLAKDKASELERPYKQDKEANKKLRRYVALRMEEYGELGIQRD